MAITPIDANSFALQSPYDIPSESLIVNTNTNVSEDTNLAVNGIEPTATAVAVNPIPPESIELRELQDSILSAFDDLKSGDISREEFGDFLKDSGINLKESQENNEIPITNEQNNQNILDLTSALIETLRNNSEDGNIELSSFASLNDIINNETQSPSVNEQLQAYTQNLRN